MVVGSGADPAVEVGPEDSVVGTGFVVGMGWGKGKENHEEGHLDELQDLMWGLAAEDERRT